MPNILKKFSIALLCAATAAIAASSDATYDERVAAPPASAPTTTPGLSAQESSAAPLFESSFDAALARAKKEGKPLFVEFMRSGCPYCAKMENDVYPLPATKAFAQRVVWLRVNIQKGEGPALSARYKVAATPTYAAVGHDGTSVYFRFDGALPAAGFLHSMSILDRTAGASDLLLPEGREPTAAEMFAVARSKLITGDLAGGKAMLERLIERDSANASGLADDALLLLGHIENSTLTSDGTDRAYGDWLRLMRTLPSSDRAPDAAVSMRKVLQALGQLDKANRLAKLLKKYPIDIDINACVEVIQAKEPAKPAQDSDAKHD